MSSYTSSLGLELITPGSQAGLWGNTTNNTFTLVDQAICGVTPLSFNSYGETVTLTDYNGAADQARSAVLNITGSATGSNTVIIPNKQKTYLVRNYTGQTVVFQTPTAGATYPVDAGYSILIFCDGNNNVYTGIAAPNVGTLSVSGGGTGSTTFGAGGFVKSSGTTNPLTASLYVNAATELSGYTPVANGGTGVGSISANALVVGTGTTAIGTIAPGTAGQVLTSNGTVWAPATPTSGVSSISGGTNITITGSASTPIVNLTGQVGVANGGTGTNTFTAGFLKSPGLTGQFTTVSTVDLGSSDVSGNLPPSRGGTGQASLTGSALLVGNGTGSVTFISPGGADTYLKSNGSTWAAAALPSSVTSVSGSGLGISVTGTTSVTISNTGVTSVNGQTGAVTVTAGTGTVTSVAASGGATGLSFTGTPITTSGTLTLGGTLGVGYGGTGATNAAQALTNLGAYPATNPTGFITSAGSCAYASSAGSATTATTASGLVNSPSIYNATFTGNYIGAGAPAINATNRVNIYYNSTGSGAASAMLAVSGYATPDPDSGSVILLSNQAALPGVRDKYIRVTQVGALEVLNTAYSSQLLRLLNTGDFYIAGNGFKPGGGSWADSSDPRLKENFQPLTGALDLVCKFAPGTYSWKYDRPGVTNVGFLADAVQKILPSAVSETEPTEEQKPFIPEGEKVLNIGWQNDMIAYLVGAIQELKAEIDALKAAK